MNKSQPQSRALISRGLGGVAGLAASAKSISIWAPNNSLTQEVALPDIVTTPELLVDSSSRPKSYGSGPYFCSLFILYKTLSKVNTHLLSCLSDIKRWCERGSAQREAGTGLCVSRGATSCCRNKTSAISDAQNTRRSRLAHTTCPMRAAWVSDYHCHLRVRLREWLCVKVPRSLASNSMLWPRRDVSLLFTAHGSGPDTGTCPRSREILAKVTSGVHTLLQGVDRSKMLQTHITHEEAAPTSWKLCVLRRL